MAGGGGFRDLFVFGRWVLVCGVCCYLVVVAGCLRCLVFFALFVWGGIVVAVWDVLVLVWLVVNSVVIIK